MGLIVTLLVNEGKTLWDWLGVILIPSMIPLILAIYTFLSTISMTTQQTIAMQWQTDQQLKSEILRSYTNTIQDLILHERLLQSKSGENVQTVATTQTTLVLSQLDGERKAYLLRFIYQLGLINIQDTIINLNGSNLTGANLAGADLRRTNLTGANLTGADLRRTNLTGANLHKTYLTEANLSHAILLNTDLSWSTLIRANLRGADMTGASLTEAKQTEAILPNGSRNP
jgi:uncharacterized protein YjbI with pentapeptide repeats